MKVRQQSRETGTGWTGRDQPAVLRTHAVSCRMTLTSATSSLQPHERTLVPAGGPLGRLTTLSGIQ